MGAALFIAGVVAMIIGARLSKSYVRKALGADYTPGQMRAVRRQAGVVPTWVYFLVMAGWTALAAGLGTLFLGWGVCFRWC